MKYRASANRNFGLTFFIVFLLIGIWPLTDFGQVRIWSLIISVIFLTLGIINSRLLSPLNYIWIKFGELLGRIVSPVVMGIVFFIVITPIGFCMRLMGKDLLKTKFSKKNSYWISRDKNVGSMKKQF